MEYADEIEALLHERKRYPIGVRNQNADQLDYIVERMSAKSEQKILIMPSGALSPSSRVYPGIRALVLADHFVTHIAALGAIWKPGTMIDFQLLALSPTQPKTLQVGWFPGVAALSDMGRDLELVDQELKLDKVKLQKLAAWLGGSAVDETAQHPYEVFNPARLSADFYDPELIANEQQIRSGEFVPLGEVAEIITPRPSNEQRKVLRGSDMRYPLDLAGLEVGRGSSEAVRQGDIVLPRFGAGTPYLIRDQVGESVYVSQNHLIIRLSDGSSFTPEYLTLYLSSSTGRKYAKRHQRGSVLPTMTRLDLETFPIVIASPAVVKRSAALFNAQFQDVDASLSPLERFNEQLFKSLDAPANTIEAEYLLEQLEQVKAWKLSALRAVMEADLREIETCLNVGAYKSCIILCGSVLEALLLDWLSEIDRRDYVTTEADHTLFTLIKELVGRRVFGSREADAAHSVRRSRNKVHPREMLRAAEITEKECRAIVGTTRKIIEKRVAGGARSRGGVAPV